MYVSSLFLQVTPADSDLSHQNSDVIHAFFSPNGSYIVTADATGRVLVWHVKGTRDGGDISSDAIKMMIVESGDALVYLQW